MSIIKLCGIIMLVALLAGAEEDCAATMTANGNGTVTDSATGLIWQQGEGGTMTWGNALAYCEGLTLAGQGDWRLPSVKELESLTDDSRHKPALDKTYFANVVSSYYWSSTTLAYLAATAWVVTFDNGYVLNYFKNDDFYVRCVRGGQSGALDNLVLTLTKTGTGGGTVTADKGDVSSGTASYASGTVVKLTAAEDSGSTFTGWSVDCSGTVNPYTLTMDTNKSCTATFNLSMFTITTSGTPANGSINCATPVDYNASSACAITPASGYYLTSFTVGGVDKLVQVTNNAYTITNITGNQTVSGSFAPNAINGACGTRSGQTLGSAPTTNLCSTGTASGVTGAGPWSWTCQGLNGGTTANCSANFLQIAGDADKNGIVTITETRSAIDMFLGNRAVEGYVDTSGDGKVSSSEAQMVINGLLGL